MSKDAYRTDLEINQIKEIISEKHNVSQIFLDKTYLHYFDSEGVSRSFSLDDWSEKIDDWSEKTFHFDNTQWIPICSDDKFFYLRELKPQTKQKIMVWEKAKDKVSKVIGPLDDLNFQYRGRGSGLHTATNKIHQIFVDESFLYLGMTNGNVIVIEKENWTIHKKIQTKIPSAIPKISKITSDQNNLYFGSNQSEFISNQQFHYIKIYEKDNFEELHEIEVNEGVFGLYQDNSDLYIHLSNAEIEVYSKTNWKKKYSLPIVTNAFNLDSQYLYFAVNDEIKIHRKTDLSRFISFKHGIKAGLTYILPGKDFLILASKKGKKIVVLQEIVATIKKSLETRISKLSNIALRTEFLELENLRVLLGFKEIVALLDWLYMLPIDMPFVIRGERIEFDINQARKIKPIEEIEKLAEAYETWYKKEKEQKIENIMKKTEFLEAEILSKLLDFENKLILMNWIYALPPEIPIIVKGEEVFFDLKSVQKQDIAKIIDLLINQYSKFEEEKRDKKEN